MSQTEYPRSDFIGTEDDATVKRVVEYGAFVELASNGETGYIHISRVREEFTEAPLSRILQPEDILKIVVVGYSEKYRCLEVSCNARAALSKFRNTGLATGDRCAGEVVHATELGALVRIEGIVVALTSPPTPWSTYRVLFEAGHLSPGKPIEVEVERWNPRSEKLQVKLVRKSPEHWTDQREVVGQVILVRPWYVKGNKRRLQSVIYAAIGGSTNDIARIVTSELLDVESAFPVGSEMALEVGKVNTYTGAFDAQPIWRATNFEFPRTLALGEKYEARVIWTAPFGANCLIDNRVVAFIHKSSVIGEVHDRLDNFLALGDIVEVKVVEKLNSGTNTWKADFVRRIKNRIEESPTSESSLIDLEAFRREGKSGGFARDASFRWSVLEAYDHTCCVCGAKHVVKNASAMEAAHVVPRSFRGSDNLQNALCLCPIHHWAFDKGFLTVDEEHFVNVSKFALEAGDQSAWLSALDSKPAYLDKQSPISPAALAWHRRNVFLDNLF